MDQGLTRSALADDGTLKVFLRGDTEACAF